MNPPVQQTIHRPSRRWLLWILIPSGVLALGLFAVVGAVWSSVHLGSDARALRASAHKASGVAWHREVEIRVGALPLGLARAVLGFVHQAPAEARVALRAVRGIEVGVYRAPSSSFDIDGGAVLTATDDTMVARGWERVVGVTQDREVVGIYVPRDLHSLQDVEVCVMVLDGAELVVVSVRGNVETAMELVEHRADWHPRLLPPRKD